MERLAEILEKINREKRVKELIQWIQNKNTSAAKNFKKIIMEGEIQSIRAYKLKDATLNLLEDSPIVKYYNNDKAIWIKNYKGGRQSRSIRRMKSRSTRKTKSTVKENVVWY